MVTDYRNPSSQTTSTMSQPGGLAGTLSPQDWTNMVGSVMNQIPWQQIFSMFQAQPQLAGRSGLGTMGVAPTAGGYGGYGGAGALSPQDWTSIVSSVVSQIPWQQIFSLFQAQPQLAGHGGLGTMGVAPAAGASGGYGGAGALSPQDWTSIIGPTIQGVLLPIFSLLQAQPQLAGRAA
jgi:hypothetical protein